MVERLSQGPISVTRLAEPLEMTLAAVVQHLQVLEKSGLVRTTKAGAGAHLPVWSPRGFRVAETWIGERRTLWERRLDRLGSLLAEE